MTLEDMEWAAKIYTKCEKLCYTDIVGLNYRVNREGSLVSQAYKSIRTIINSYENNKLLYKDLPSEIKYRLLGFDFYQIRHNIDEAYQKGIISTFELWEIINKLNTKEINYYIYDDLLPNEYELRLNFRKSLLKKHCPKLYQTFINLLKPV